jgi:hypothetical protein
MKRSWVAAAVTGLALLTFFQFPGHTWLQQDTQIYVPILEHQRDPLLLRNDLIAQYPHDAFTLYDEVAIALRRASGLGFREVLQVQQIVTRALGIWGLLLLAEAFGLSTLQAFAVAAICSLGVSIAGPSVLTLEYEPTPRAFAVPLIFCAMGLAAQRRYMAASVAASIAFLYHAPTTIPFWAVFGIVLLLRRRWREFAPILAAAGAIVIAAHGQDTGGFYGRLTAAQEQLQRMRASYVWISTWPAARIANYFMVFAVALGAFLRARGKDWTLMAMAGIGLLSVPISWLLLERLKWALIPQLQPLRALLFVALAMQFLCAVAGLKSRQWYERWAWFAAAYFLAVQPVVTEAWAWRPVLVVVGLAAMSAAMPALSLPGALAAFLAIPILGGIVNYPNLHTPELAQLSAWAKTSTPRDAVFLFPDVGRRLDPGIFRPEALRAVYVDWKGGGQVNYIRDFADAWWFRWQMTMIPKFTPAALAKYDALGIQYIIVQPKDRLPRPAEFENGSWLAYRIAR